MTEESRPRLPTIERSRLSDRIATQLRHLVVQGHYPQGSRLPSAEELARQLGVTRLTVREALAQLQSAGLVRIRHGSGTYVVDPAETATLQMLAETLSAGRAMSADEIRSLLEFRTVMILGFVPAIARRGMESVDRLDAIVAAERAALGRPAELAELDYRFNEVLAFASGNLFYTLLLRSVKRAHLHLGEIVFSNAGDGTIVVDTHEAIVRSLRKGDAQAAERRLQMYIAGGNRIVNDWLRRKKR